MPHAIIRGANARRHEVDFGDTPVRVEIYASEETVEIFIEAEFDLIVVAIAEDRSGYVVGVKVHASPQLHSRFKKAYRDPG